jgi:single-stranded DNA-binding protein
MTASITLVGRCATPPAAVFYESGAVRVTFSLTINRRRFGEPSEPFLLELWGKPAQRAHDEVKTGALIGVIGDLRMHDSKPWVLVDRLEVLGAPRNTAAEVVA